MTLLHADATQAPVPREDPRGTVGSTFLPLVILLASLLLQILPTSGPAWQLGQNIALLRRRARLNQSQLARRLEVTRQTVSRWETGQHMPDRRHLAALSLAFGVTYDQLFDPGDDGDDRRNA